MFNQSKTMQKDRKGLTLIELMLVLVILVILASSVGYFVGNAQQNALKDSARAQVGRLETCVSGYQVDVRGLPSNNNGLNALLAAPSDLANPARWRGPYIKSTTIPLDPWDNQYMYSQVGPNDFKIWSMGPDRADGTADDISNKDQS